MFELVYCSIFVVETKGLSLEETAAIFDKDDGPKIESRSSPSTDAEFGGAVLVPKTSENYDMKSVSSVSSEHSTLKPV